MKYIIFGFIAGHNKEINNWNLFLPDSLKNFEDILFFFWQEKTTRNCVTCPCLFLSSLLMWCTDTWYSFWSGVSCLVGMRKAFSVSYFVSQNEIIFSEESGPFVVFLSRSYFAHLAWKLFFSLVSKATSYLVLTKFCPQLGIAM